MATNFSKKDMIKLQNLLRKSKKTITTAESCTGGLVASLITKISGSSDIFNGSIVTYSNNIKKIKTYHLKGSRISIQKQSANIALSKILKFVSKTIDN